jgi:putative nucleotidyltransferase with HDIG domain
MERDTALQIVKKYIRNPHLVNHMLAVEVVMRFYANKLDQPEDLWGLTGLLHDFDWEIHPTKEQHPADGTAILRNLAVPEEIIQAILRHGDHLNLPRETLLQKGLYACDEITGLITAVALVRPSKSLYDLEPGSIKKKWKDKAFAAGADRAAMETGAVEFDVPLWEHCENVIKAMRTIAPTLGLEGNLSAISTSIVESN